METKSYCLGNIEAMYLISEEGRVSLLLLPLDCSVKPAKNWELGPGKWDPRGEYFREWRHGSLVQLHLRHHARSRGNGLTEKFSESTAKLKFDKQWTEEEPERKLVITQLSAAEGYRITHTLGWEKGRKALWCQTEFENTGDQVYELEMLTSFCLENLSPYQFDNDQTDVLALHRFTGNWALEGKHVCQPIEELGLQKAWASAFPQGERFGSVGSWTTHRYFPTAAIEDKQNHILWAASLETLSSWQMELTRDGDTLSFSGGIADMEQGAWMKVIRPGGHFTAPRARLTAVEGDIQDACQALLDLQYLAAEQYGEQGLPITFNEYCSSWGNPTQEKELEYAGILRDKGIRYFVIDAGWTEGSREQWGNGEWLPDQKRFPDIRGLNRQLREMGMVPGIWFEFEVTTEGSAVFAESYDPMHLKRDGHVIRFGTDRTFWDFRNPKVQEFLTERVINFLRDNDFGYMKVDYNGNIGLGCDGAESLGEGLRRQMEAVADFFRKIRKEVPGIIIENCASGGHRLEPAMMSLTALSSFSDAHEPREIPYIAANLQNLCIPGQNLIWAVLRADDSTERLIYSIAAGFLGRLCLSGDIEQLDASQWETVSAGLDLYRQAEGILMRGTTRVYADVTEYIRHPKGIQAVARENEDGMLIVVHGYENAGQKLCVPLGKAYRAAGSYGTLPYRMNGQTLEIEGMADWTAGVLLLR